MRIVHLSLAVVLLLLNLFQPHLPGEFRESEFESQTNVLQAADTHRLTRRALTLTINEMITIVRVYYSEHKELVTLTSWLEPWEVHPDQGYVVVGVNPDQYARLLRQGFRVKIDEELTDFYNRPARRAPEQTSGIPGYPCYRLITETYQYAETLVQTYPNLATWIDIGDSWEKTYTSAGFDLHVLRLTNAAISSIKPRLFIMASIHPREYAPAELATRFAAYLLENYNIDPDITWVLDHQEVHLLFQANPDGRRLAETGTGSPFSWWRKNTNINTCLSNPQQRGVDLNRNFDFMWGCCGGSSGSSCDDTYRGVAPASEPETQAVQAYVRSLFPDRRGTSLSDSAPEDVNGIFVDLHSYGRLVLWSWGFSANEPPNSTGLRTLGKKFAYFNLYEPTQAYHLYPTDGTTDDFVYGELGLPAYTFELGNSFFENCEVFNNTIWPDNLNALLYAARVTRRPYQLPAGPDVAAIEPLPSAIKLGHPFQFSARLEDGRYYNGYFPPQILEPVQSVQAAAYSIDIPLWITTTPPITYPLTALDGAFDQPVEWVSGTVTTTELLPGRHTLFVHGQDTTGQWGAVSSAFFYLADTIVFLPIIQR